MRPKTPNFNFAQQAGPSSPPATPTTSAFPSNRRHGINFSRPISAQLDGAIIPNGNGAFSYNPFQPLDELSPRSSSPTSSIHSASSSEADPQSRSPSPEQHVTSSPPKPRVRTRVITEMNFALEEFDEEDYEAFNSEAESIIRPYQYEDAESDRARSVKASSPSRELDPKILHGLRDLKCDEALLDEQEAWQKKMREEKRRRRRSSGTKRSLAQSIGSDTDDEDLQPVQFDANEAGSSARRLRRKVGDRSSLIFDDPPARIEELEEPESCEEVVDIPDDDEQGLRQLPYYEQVMEVDSEDEE